MIEPTLHLTHDQFDRARELIEERAGIYCPDSREQVLRRALAARMHLCAIADWRHYLQLLTSAATGDAEFRQLLRYITISETSFFRIPSQFQALRQVLVPSIVAASPAGTLNIWSAGCSTGEEPYSIAITLEDMGAALRRWQVHILATDVRPEAVECGRLGRYRERALRGASRDHRARYFARRDDEYEVSPHLRQRVRLQELNLAASRYPRPAPNGWDIIFCRNVTMYFRPQTARQVIARFREALRPGGFLVLSPTECLCTVSTAFEIIEAAGAFIYVKPPLDAALAALRPSGAAPHAPAADAHPRPPQPAHRRVGHPAARAKPSAMRAPARSPPRRRTCWRKPSTPSCPLPPTRVPYGRARCWRGCARCAANGSRRRPGAWNCWRTTRCWRRRTTSWAASPATPGKRTKARNTSQRPSTATAAWSPLTITWGSRAPAAGTTRAPCAPSAAPCARWAKAMTRGSISAKG